jgi:hypothetical protein
MIFPYEHADKILFFNRTARNPCYLIGSPQHKLIEYKIPDLNVHILCEKHDMIVDAPSWQVLFNTVYKYEQNGSYFNNKILKEDNPLLLAGGYNFTVEYAGSLEKCLADITFLWFQYS